jgi:hypothetical protein
MLHYRKTDKDYRSKCSGLLTKNFEGKCDLRYIDQMLWTLRKWIIVIVEVGGKKKVKFCGSFWLIMM